MQGLSFPWFRKGSALGRRGERLAARYLRGQGLRILARNVRCGRGEIDIVAAEGDDTLVFVEVKSRTPRSLCEGLEKIDSRKRRALRRACRYYLCRTPEPVISYRVDGVSVEFRDGLLWPRLLQIEWTRSILQLDD